VTQREGEYDNCILSVSAHLSQLPPLGLGVSANAYQDRTPNQ